MSSARLANKGQHTKQPSYAAAIVTASHRTPQAVMMHPQGAQDTISPVPDLRYDQG